MNRNRKKIGIGLSKRAVDRYIDSQRPGLTCPQARQELGRMIDDHGKLTDRPPVWHADDRSDRADSYLLMGEDYLMPLSGGDDVYVAIDSAAYEDLSEDPSECQEPRRRRSPARRHRRRR